jgi:hypothetical protein
MSGCDCPPGWKHRPDCHHVTGPSTGELRARVLAETWQGVYPGMCVDPEYCRGKTSCPRNYSCSE